MYFSLENDIIKDERFVTSEDNMETNNEETGKIDAVINGIVIVHKLLFILN